MNVATIIEVSDTWPSGTIVLTGFLLFRTYVEAEEYLETYKSAPKDPWLTEYKAVYSSPRYVEVVDADIWSKVNRPNSIFVRHFRLGNENQGFREMN